MKASLFQDEYLFCVPFRRRQAAAENAGPAIVTAEAFINTA